MTGPLRVRVAATFTADPIADVLDFWAAELGLDAVVGFAAHGQVFQDLLGVHDEPGPEVLLLRLADWLGDPETPGRLEDMMADLAAAVRTAADSRADPILVHGRDGAESMILARKRQYLFHPGLDHGKGPEVSAIMSPGRHDPGQDGQGEHDLGQDGE